jgi:pimeloyl-ACP methyl ester carboxylesterase
MRTWIAALGFALLMVGAARAAEPDPDFGIPAFMAWEAKSSIAHGGQHAALDGISLYYQTYGAGPPVLVLHGGTAFSETMHNQITALAPRHLVIAPDSRAHGRSTDGPGPLSYHQMAEDMIARMDQLHIAKADLVGWSDGGIIGLDLAIHHPERIGRMVVIGTNFDVSGISDAAMPGPDDPSLVSRKQVYQMLSPTPAQWPVFYGKVTTMWRTQPNYSLAELGAIRSPVLVMAGENDDIRRAHTDALAKAIPGAREVIIPGATHLAPLTHPEAVDAAILDFIGGMPAL